MYAKKNEKGRKTQILVHYFNSVIESKMFSVQSLQTLNNSSSQCVPLSSVAIYVKYFTRTQFYKIHHAIYGPI